MRKLLLLFLVLSFFITSCSLPEQNTSNDDTGQTDPPSGLVVNVDCIDNTLSVPIDFTTSVQGYIADDIESHVEEVPFRDYARYIRTIGAADTFGVQGEVLTILIDGVGEEPTASEQGNVFDSKSKQEAEDQLRLEQNQWREDLQSSQQLAGSLSEQARTIDIGREDRASDIRGCLIKARELIDQQEDVYKANLLVASDFQGTGPQQDISLLDLTGINVTAIQLCQSSASECLDIKNQISDDLHEAGAREFVLLDTSQI